MNEIYVLTAGHCVNRLEEWTYTMEGGAELLIGHTIGYEFTASSNGWDQDSREADWGVIRVIPEAYQYISPDSAFGGFGRSPIDFEPKEGDKVCLIGTSLMNTVMGALRCGSYDGHNNSTNNEENTGLQVFYRIHTYGGDSGSVVFHWETGIPIAIHTNGGPTESGFGFNICSAVYQAEKMLGPLEILTDSHYVPPRDDSTDDIESPQLLLEPFQGKRDCEYEKTSNTVRWNLIEPERPEF